ncbi:MAG: IS21 family transposase [Halomonas sp.]|nr:IS21 family transposase [Halomonas sp.]
MIHKIKAMHDNGEGMTLRAISRELNISRNTVKKYLEMDEQSVSVMLAEPSRVKWLDNYRDFLINQLQAYPRLSAVKLMRRLKMKVGQLKISDRSIRRYVKKLKQEVALGQHRYYEPIIETVPGVQCQVDPGELSQVLISGEPQTVYFVVFVLSFSRLMYVGVSLKPLNTLRFIEMHNEAFRYFGGVTQECVYDQTKMVVLHEQYRELELNARFHQYATTTGLRIHACEGFDPESKGKVEAGVKYVKQNCLYGETFTNESALREHVRQWLDEVANQRTHGTTNQRPQYHYDHFERSHMLHYQPSMVQLCNDNLLTRQVDKTGLISWRSNKYSVPMVWQQNRIAVSEQDGKLLLHEPATGEVIAEHTVSLEKGQIIKNRDHYRDKTQAVEVLEAELQALLSGDHGLAIAALLKATMPRFYKDQLRGAIDILKQHDVLPEGLMAYILARDNLTATQLRDHIIAWKSAQVRGRVDDSSHNSSAEPIDLSIYQQVTQTSARRGWL